MSPSQKVLRPLIRTRLLPLVMLALAVSGCVGGPQPTVKQFGKALERQAYGDVADVFSSFCGYTSDNGAAAHTRLELSREIRQHGANGPPAPPSVYRGFAFQAGDENLIDPKMRYGRGPVVMVYCQSDQVPEVVWQKLDRWWKD